MISKGNCPCRIFAVALRPRVPPILRALSERVLDFHLLPGLSGPQSPSSPNVRKICHQLPLPSSHARRHIVPGSLASPDSPPSLSGQVLQSSSPAQRPTPPAFVL